MIKATIVALLFFACSAQQPVLSEFQACRSVHSCSSCTKKERCDVTARDPEGWPTARECCPK